MNSTSDSTLERHTIKIIYSAWVRDFIGLPEEALDIPATIVTVVDLIRWLRARGDPYETAFADETVVRVAIDHVHVKLHSPLGKAQTIAFFPPMTGGQRR